MYTITPTKVIGDTAKSVNTFVAAMPQSVATLSELGSTDSVVNKKHLSGKQLGSTVIMVNATGELVGLAIASGGNPDDEWLVAGELPEAPVITVDLPPTLNVVVPNSLVIGITATGADTYDWYVNDILWDFQHTATVTIDPTPAEIVGTYNIYVVAKNADMSTQSSTCVLTISAS